MKVGHIDFPEFSGLRCLMMPYIQGDPDSVPREYEAYSDIIRSVCLEPGEVGWLTIDESYALAGKPHRGARAKHGRALHTEAGKRPHAYAWGGSDGGHGWGSSPNVTLDRNTQVLLANSLDDSCAVWNTEHEDTSWDGDIGDKADAYPYANAEMMKAGDVHQIGILTPHESMPMPANTKRQFLRIVGVGVTGREPYFTENPLVSV